MLNVDNAWIWESLPNVEKGWEIVPNVETVWIWESNKKCAKSWGSMVIAEKVWWKLLKVEKM